MNSMSNEDKQTQGDGLAKDMAGKAGSGAKQAGKAVVRKASKGIGKKVAGMAAKKLAFAMAQGFAATLKLLAPVLIGFLIVVFIVISAWYVMFEMRGKDQEYSEKDVHQNEMQVDDKYGNSVKEVSGQNTAIIDFYRNQERFGYWQIIDEEDDPSWNFIKPVMPYKLTDKNPGIKGDVPYGLTKADGSVEDYYKQEKTYTMNANFLFSLDEDLHRQAFRYPEQFLKPVYYEELENGEMQERKDKVKPARGVGSPEDPYIATSDKGVSVKQKKLADPQLEAESRVFDEEKNEFTEKTEKSVHDWGLATIFEYRTDKIIRTVEGVWTKEDYYDKGCDCVKQKPISIEYVYMMKGYPITIWLIEHATTFNMDIELAYENFKEPVGPLRDATDTDPASDANRIFYKTHDVYETRTRMIQDPSDPKKEVVEEYEVFVKTVDLYRFREGEIMEDKPMPMPERFVKEDHGTDYLMDYGFFYRSWVPKSVMAKFDFEERMGGITMDLGNIETGTHTNNANYTRSMQYYDIIEKYAGQFGVDPNLIVALIAQESGGKAHIKDGLMQIVNLGNDPRAVTAKNNSGQSETFYIGGNERNDPEKSIKWGVMYFASKMQAYDNNPLKALQSYNFDVSGFMKKNYPEAWMDSGNAWMQYREEARVSLATAAGYSGSKSASYWCAPNLEKSGGSRWGDICYIENVMRYYAGDKLEGFAPNTPETPVEGSEPEKEPEKESGGLFDSIKKIIAAIIGKEYKEDEPRRVFEHSMNKWEVVDVMKQASTFDKKILFSETGDADSKQFWEEGFNPATAAPVAGGSYESFTNLVPNASGYITPLAIPNPIVTSCYGMRLHPIEKVMKLHRGVDVGVPTGTPQYAISDGVVEVSRNMGTGWGEYVTVRFTDGNSAVYAHLSQRLVQVGQQVKQGQAIGLTGTTGSSTAPHMHFEFNVGGQYVDPYFIVVGAGKSQAACK